MDALTGRSVFVTGASGFVGANIVRQLAKMGAEVHAQVRPTSSTWRLSGITPPVRLHSLDLTHRESVISTLREARPKIIINSAHPPGHPLNFEAFTEGLDSSIRLTGTLIEAAMTVGFDKFIQIGSSLEYGPSKSPLRESDPASPMSLRGVAKAATTLLCRQLAISNSLPLAILRLFSVYGYWESKSRFIPAIILAALRHEQVRLTPPGYRHDFVFVEDVVEACLLAAQREVSSGEIINVGSGQQWSNEQVVDLVKDISGSNIDVCVGSYPVQSHDTAFWVADTTGARIRLGWSPRHDLRSGLEKTLSWFRAQSPSIGEI